MKVFAGAPPNQLVPRGPSTKGKDTLYPSQPSAGTKTVNTNLCFQKGVGHCVVSQTGLSETCGFFTWLGLYSWVWWGREGPLIRRYRGQEALQPSVHTQVAALPEQELVRSPGQSRVPAPTGAHNPAPGLP